jgi:hypothetical protein
MSSESDWQDYCQERSERGRRARCTQLGIDYPFYIEIDYTHGMTDEECLPFAEDFYPFCLNELHKDLHKCYFKSILWELKEIVPVYGQFDILGEWGTRDIDS